LPSIFKIHNTPQGKAIQCHRGFVDENVSPQLALFGVFGDFGLSGSGVSGATGDMSSPLRLLDASYRSNQDGGSNESINESADRGGSRPPPYLAIVFGGFCLCGFTLACIGLEGSGHPVYLFGGWIIAAAAGSALVWWWV